MSQGEGSLPGPGQALPAVEEEHLLEPPSGLASPERRCVLAIKTQLFVHSKGLTLIYLFIKLSSNLGWRVASSWGVLEALLRAHLLKSNIFSNLQNLRTSCFPLLRCKHQVVTTEILYLSSNHRLLYTSPSPRDRQKSRMPSSA